jgi:hypothetical protein
MDTGRREPLRVEQGWADESDEERGAKDGHMWKQDFGACFCPKEAKTVTKAGAPHEVTLLKAGALAQANKTRQPKPVATRRLA